MDKNASFAESVKRTCGKETCYTDPNFSGMGAHKETLYHPHTLLTADHNFVEHWMLLCVEIHIKKNAWIGAKVVILPDVMVGENAIVAS